MMEATKENQKKIINIIRTCGAVVRSAHDVESQSGAITVKPGAANFVTLFDVNVQNTLISRLSALYPQANFFAEEKDNDGACFKDAYCFVIDPIDGTTNFIHDMKYSAISVALYYDGMPLFGAVYNPYMDEMFHASVGGGAYLNDRPIRVSGRSLDKALVLFGTSPYNREEHGRDTFKRVYNVFMKCADVRRSGSAALDVCYVACGRVDAYFEDILSPWDFAAGLLILTEAGGKMTSYSGEQPKAGEKTSVLCSNKLLHSEMLQLLNK